MDTTPLYEPWESLAQNYAERIISGKTTFEKIPYSPPILRMRITEILTNDI